MAIPIKRANEFRPFMGIRSIDIIGCQHTEEKRHSLLPNDDPHFRFADVLYRQT